MPLLGSTQGDPYPSLCEESWTAQIDAWKNGIPTHFPHIPAGTGASLVCKRITLPEHSAPPNLQVAKSKSCGIRPHSSRAHNTSIVNGTLNSIKEDSGSANLIEQAAYDR